MPGHDSFHLKSNKTMIYDISEPTSPAVPKLGKGTDLVHG